MKRITFILFLLTALCSFGQNLSNPSQIGQTTRNHKVGNGFQVDDTLLVKGVIWMPSVMNGSGTDSLLTVKDGLLKKIPAITSSRAVDTIFRTAAKDSIIFTIGGTRYAIKDSTGGGGASLDGLTSAVDTNTLNNGTNNQTWNWNNLPASGVGLTLNHVGTNTLSNLITTQASTLKVTMSGLHTGVNHHTTAGYFSNTSTGSSSYNYAIYAEASGGSDGNYAVVSTGDTWQRTGGIYFTATPTNNFILPISGGGFLNRCSGNGFFYTPASVVGITVTDVNASIYYEKPAINLSPISSTRQSIVMGGSVFNTTPHYSGTGSTVAIIERQDDKLIFSANTGLTGGVYSGHAPNQIMTVYGTNSNVGIGTTSPNASSLLDLVSTTKFLTPPRMTEAQRDAVGSPQAGNTLFCTDCTATDASTGVMQTYNGTGWKNYW